MEKFQLSLLFKIIGIGSASGLVCHQDSLYLISDNSTYLYQYNMTEQHLHKIALTENPQENIPKKDKPDFEAIAQRGNDLVILGSGSTDKRNRILAYNMPSKKIKAKDNSALFAEIKSQLDVKDDELNIEGLIFNQATIYLFQRGNASHSKNAVIFSTDESPYAPEFKKMAFELPKIKNVECTFTDAVLVEGTIYFLAAAEDTDSTYHDGEVLGSIIGGMDPITLQLKFTRQISDKQKFEGLTFYRKTEAGIEFLLCEDNDSGIPESGIYKLILQP